MCLAVESCHGWCRALAASAILGGGASAHHSQRHSHWIAFARYGPDFEKEATFLVKQMLGAVLRVPGSNFAGQSSSAKPGIYQHSRQSC